MTTVWVCGDAPAPSGEGRTFFSSVVVGRIADLSKDSSRVSSASRAFSSAMSGGTVAGDGEGAGLDKGSGGGTRS